MAQTNPYNPNAAATYRIFTQKDGTFGVEVSLPGAPPTSVTGFEMRLDAAIWIEKRKQAVWALQH